MSLWQRIFISSTQGATQIVWSQPLTYVQILAIRTRGFKVQERSKGDDLFYQISW